MDEAVEEQEKADVDRWIVDMALGIRISCKLVYLRQSSEDLSDRTVSHNASTWINNASARG